MVLVGASTRVMPSPSTSKIIATAMSLAADILVYSSGMNDFGARGTPARQANARLIQTRRSTGVPPSVCRPQLTVSDSAPFRVSFEGWMLRRRMNNCIELPPHFESLLLGCIDADFFQVTQQLFVFRNLHTFAFSLRRSSLL